TKTRDRDGSVVWTSPTGRRYRSPSPHPPVPTPRPARPADPDLEAWLALPDAVRDDHDRHTDPSSPLWTHWDTGLADPAWLAATPDHDPDADTDRLGELIRAGHSLWHLDRHDPYSWHEPVPPPDDPPAEQPPAEL
ncbi:MAG TPA: hypothetical protein VNU26_14585, partial [Mycobacteriales bacterium]|nr:hypothetical protein [Mycobacteriales bacterium]